MDGTREVAWHRDAMPQLTPLDHDVEVDSCVVGLGGSGLAAIGALLARGERVVGLDRAGVAAGAAGRNGGFLLAGTAAFHHDAAADLGRARAAAIYRLTLEEMDRIAHETPGCVARTGSLRIASDAAEETDCDRQRDAMERDGLPVEQYTGPEGEGLLFPHDGAFNPAARCGELAARAIRGGAKLFAPAEVSEIGDGFVRVGSARVRCTRVFVLVDGGLGRILPELAATVRTARLQMLGTAPGVPPRWPRPVYYRYGYEYWQQRDDGTVLLGGFRDQAGDAEWTASDIPSAEVQGRLDAFLRQHLGVEAPVTHRWAASVGYTAGILPYVGQPRPGVWAAGGYNGTGNVIGAICARGLVESALDGRSAALDHFDPALSSGT